MWIQTEGGDYQKFNNVFVGDLSVWDEIGDGSLLSETKARSKVGQF